MEQSMDSNMTHTRTPLTHGSAVPLADVKSRARISHDDEDMDIQRLIDAAAFEIERHAELALLRQRITLTVQPPMGDESIPLPIGPVLPDAEVTVNGAALVGGIAGHMRPVLMLPDYMRGPVLVTYEAGYGDDHRAIPADLQLAIADHAAMMYDARGLTDAPQGLSIAAARIATRYRRVGI